MDTPSYLEICYNNVFLVYSGVDTDELENMTEEEYDEEIVEFLLKVEEIILDEE